MLAVLFTFLDNVYHPMTCFHVHTIHGILLTILLDSFSSFHLGLRALFNPASQDKI